MSKYVSIIIASAVLVVIGYFLGSSTRSTEQIQSKLKGLQDGEPNNLAVKFAPHHVKENQIVTKTAVLEDIKPSQKGASVKKTVNRDLLFKMIGATDTLKWQNEYNKGLYTARYDETWKNDMYDRAYELLLDERYANELTIQKYDCSEDRCELQVENSLDSIEPAAVVASQFILDLKNHPAILESGKKRMVYINQLSTKDGRTSFDISIY